jgi:hypothetical protein
MGKVQFFKMIILLNSEIANFLLLKGNTLIGQLKKNSLQNTSLGKKKLELISSN